MPYKVESITPRGHSALHLGKLTVLVGANNSGKSRTLKDLLDYVGSGSMSGSVILTAVSDELPSESEWRVKVHLSKVDGSDSFLGSYVSSNLRERKDMQMPLQVFDMAFAARENPSSQYGKEFAMQQLGHSLVAHIDAEDRFALAASTNSYDETTSAPKNALQHFDTIRIEAQPRLRSAFYDAFGIDIGLDWTAMSMIHLRVCEGFGEIPEDRASLRALMAQAEPLSNQGHGYRSFAGVALALLTYSDRLLLMDEPEAFLHPAQARVLGRWVAQQAASRPGQVVVATHSADFLEGILSHPGQAVITRLNRDRAGTRFHVIPETIADNLARSPLLSSQPVLDALFHRGVVVCEGDPDRAVYQAVAHKLLDRTEVLFIHSNGKDAAKRPLKLMREAGVPVAAIVDFDAINSKLVLSELIMGISGAVPAPRLLLLRQEVEDSLATPSNDAAVTSMKEAVESWRAADHRDMRIARKALKAASAAGASKWAEVKKRGFAAVPAAGASAAVELAAELAKLGIFLVPGGALESWLCTTVSKGQAWNQTALQAIHDGGCPEALLDFIDAVTQHTLRLSAELHPDVSGTVISEASSASADANAPISCSA